MKEAKASFIVGKFFDSLKVFPYIIDHLTHYSYEYLFEVHLCAQ